MSEDGKVKERFCPKCGRRYSVGISSCPEDGATLLPLGKHDDLSGTLILDKYLLVQRLGRGAFGAVYRAFHLVAKTDVAVKVLNSEILKQDPKASKMARDTFIREARAVMGMQSRHVVIVHDVDEDPVVGPFVVMEFVQGVTLDKYVEMTAPDRKRLPLGEVISIAIQVCDALEDAHDRGIVHRDLKPSNIMILRGKDGGIFAKVLDFGIAKVAHKEGTDLTTLASFEGIVGTPAYMSPEQCSGLPVDARSDIYTLGVILYELCTGTLPFTGSSPLAFIVAHATQNPRAMTEVIDKREVPRELDRLIGLMLKKKPEERPQTIREVRKALEKVKVQQARPKPTRKYLWVAAGGLLLVLSGLAIWKRESSEQEPKKQVAPFQYDTATTSNAVLEPSSFDGGNSLVPPAGIASDGNILDGLDANRKSVVDQEVPKKASVATKEERGTKQVTPNGRQAQKRQKTTQKTANNQTDLSQPVGEQRTSGGGPQGTENGKTDTKGDEAFDYRREFGR